MRERSGQVGRNDFKKQAIMNSDLLFDFIVDKENKIIHITREFDAGLALVWQAWTTAGLLDLMVGPTTMAS